MNEEQFSERGDNPLKDIFSQLFGQKDIPSDPAIQAVLNDQRLMKIADYEVTRGYTRTKNVTQEDVADKFTEFKSMIMHKESTLAELETMVYTKYGIQEPVRKLAPEAERKPIIGFHTGESFD